MMGNSVCKPRNYTVQYEHPNTSMPVPFALRSVLPVHWRVPNGAPACTRVRYNVSDIAVTEDPESTKNSTEWSPIHPSKNQCPVPEICITGSSYRNGSLFMVGMTGSRTSGEKSVSADFLSILNRGPFLYVRPPARTLYSLILFCPE